MLIWIGSFKQYYQLVLQGKRQRTNYLFYFSLNFVTETNQLEN